MIKKAFVVLGVLLVGSWLWAKTDLGSYATTAWKQVRTSVKKQVPLDFEIKRAKEMLASLNKEEDKLISAMAKEMVAIEKDEQDIVRVEQASKDLAKDIKTANDDLKQGRTVLLMGRLEYTNREQFTVALERSFDRFQTLDNTLKTRRESLNQHRHTLAAAKEHLDGLQASKKDLQARIELVELELANVKAAQARSRRVCSFDESQLAKVKELVDEIEQDIKAQSYELRLRGDQPRPAATTPARRTSAELAREIDSYFGKTVAEK